MRVVIRTVGLMLAVIVAMSGGTTAAAAVLPTGFSESIVASGLRNPTAMAIAPDGRIFVCEQGGTLRLVSNQVLLPTPVRTLTVNSSGERGLLGVALDPSFESNGFIYLYYTATTPNIHNRVSRFTVVGDVATGAETILLELDPLGATNHNGGAIHFGGDGKLYVAIGDNAVGANAPSLNTRFGKMLRLNADGTIPDDNPFASQTTGVNRAIWVRGLRNPFTFAVEPISGTLYINDVGENTWEEINVGIGGSDYGWPSTEGPTTSPNIRGPLYAYTHAGGGCAIAGGAFHSPLRANFPLRYFGAYFFADLCGSWIKYLRPDGSVGDFATGVTSPVDLVAPADGRLYYLARGASSNTGVVGMITYDVTTPGVDVTVNGGDGPLTLSAGDRLQIDLSINAGSGGLNGEVYIGVITVAGLFWADPPNGFVPTPRPIYSGPLSTFGPSPLFTVSDVAVLPPGPIWWFVVLDRDANSTPQGEFADMVTTIIVP